MTTQIGGHVFNVVAWTIGHVEGAVNALLEALVNALTIVLDALGVDRANLFLIHATRDA